MNTLERQKAAARWDALSAVQLIGGGTAAEIAESLEVTTQALSGPLKFLADLGLIGHSNESPREYWLTGRGQDVIDMVEVA